MNRLAPLTLIGVMFVALGCKQEDAHAHEAEQDAGPIPPVTITVIEEGTGDGAEEADLVIVEYTGLFPNSEISFDSNAGFAKDKNGDVLMYDWGVQVKSQPPYPVLVGKSSVIEGWHEGLLGAKKGETRKLNIPWQKAYGEAGSAPNIGGRQDLDFTIKILDLVKFDEQDIVDDENLVEGTGRGVEDGDTVTIHYRGTYANGYRFDSSYERGNAEAGGEPVTFKVGRDKVIQGIDFGIRGMKVGGKRRLRVPPMLAYGPGGFQVIQGDQVLYFDIELLAIE